MRLLLLPLMILLSACTAIQPRAERWEHGWKTKDITAWRYKNETMSYNIGFVPSTRYAYDFDRAEMFEFLKQHGGFVYQGGGYAGAEVFVVFKDVKNKQDADKFLPEFLPKFQQFLEELN